MQNLLFTPELCISRSCEWGNESEHW